jgi:hypothetical protein
MSDAQKYIVIFKETATPDDIQQYVDKIQNDGGGKVEHRYDSIMKGFSATIPSTYLSSLQSNLQDSPIEYIEPDSVITTQ